MQTQSYANRTGYLLIIIGLTLSLISALVPHFDAGYTLMLSVFIAGMLPYMVYAIAVPLLRGTLTAIAGLAIVIAHTWLVYDQRILGDADYSDGMIYYIPLLLSLLALPLAVMAFKRMRFRQP